MVAVVVNVVWSGSMTNPVDLLQLQQLCNALVSVRSVKLQVKPPIQLIIKFDDGSTMLVFKTGKFRIMGKMDDLDAHFNIFSVTLLYNDIPNIKLQTMTACFTFPHRVNLALLADNIESYYNTESFPTLRVLKYKPISINVFASGKVIITGLRDDTSALHIELELTSLLYKLLPLYIHKLL